MTAATASNAPHPSAEHLAVGGKACRFVECGQDLSRGTRCSRRAGQSGRRDQRRDPLVEGRVRLESGGDPQQCRLLERTPDQLDADR